MNHPLQLVSLMDKGGTDSFTWLCGKKVYLSKANINFSLNQYKSIKKIKILKIYVSGSRRNLITHIWLTGSLEIHSLKFTCTERIIMNFLFFSGHFFQIVMEDLP